MANITLPNNTLKDKIKDLYHNSNSMYYYIYIKKKVIILSTIFHKLSKISFSYSAIDQIGRLF